MGDPENQLLMDDFDGPVVTCWACNILVAVPLGTDGLAAPVFKVRMLAIEWLCTPTCSILRAVNLQ
jgi:hypothetical protein